MNEEVEEVIAEERSQEELSEILRIRREKLKQLQAAGNDPFHIVKFDRDTSTAQISS